MLWPVKAAVLLVREVTITSLLGVPVRLLLKRLLLGAAFAAAAALA